MINVEIKAKCSDPQKIREILKENNADFKGTDHQIDTYFKVKKGRLKTREGNIENGFMYYERENNAKPKLCNYILHKTQPNNNLKEVLTKVLEPLVIVDKEREIYYIENVKFHIDRVKGLGSFVEIEATDDGGKLDKVKLLEQCKHYMELFGIDKSSLMTNSYSDMLLAQTK